MKKLLLLLLFLQISCTHTVTNRFSDNITASDEDSFVENDATHDKDSVFDEDLIPDEDEIQDEDIVIIYCDTNPCENGGVCTDEADGYHCDCSETTFTGRNCDLPTCATEPCKNGGICIDKADGYHCDCSKTGFIGADCEDEPQSAFITTWKTDNEGVSEPNQIIISTYGDGYDYAVDCDSDGVAEAHHQTGDYTCEYEKPGTYTISITGDFPQIYFNDYVFWNAEGRHTKNNYDNENILSVEQWGTNQWKSMEKAFYRCHNLTIEAVDIPDLSNVTNMEYMFCGTQSMNQNINSWDVSNVIDMMGMFGGSAFNQDISLWDVSHVTNMLGMFGNSAFNQDISSWDVSSVTNMRGMFSGTESFNKDIDSWDVSNVTNMQGMFLETKSFNKTLSSWDVSNVTDMFWMFAKSEAFNQDLNGWDTSNVTTMNGMFLKSVAFNGRIDEWDVSSVTTMENMFLESVAFNRKIESWDISNVENMTSMFRGSISFNQSLNSWDFSKDEEYFRDISYMFAGSVAFNGDINSWNMSKFRSLKYVFEDAVAFNQNLAGWDISNIESLRYSGAWPYYSIPSSMWWMLRGVTLSTENYDATLEAWSKLTPRYSVQFDAGGSKYCTGEAARQKLIDTYKWKINDGGKDSDCEE